MSDCQDTMSIHTRKITDACRDKDCIEDLRVYLTESSQTQLDNASSARVRCAELICADIEVEPVAFDRNHYCIEVRFFYRILADAVVGSSRPVTLQGMATFSKRAVLCGEDSCAHIFSSDGTIGMEGITRRRANNPIAVVEVLDPMILASQIREPGDGTMESVTVPTCAESVFDEALVIGSTGRRLYVTLGQFSIIRLERDVQIVVGVVDYSLPAKQCCDSPGCTEDPCEMFSRIPFPENRFSPRNCDPGLEHTATGCGCGCGEPPAGV